MTKTQMEELVKRQEKAYNQRDLEAFCSCYHPDIEIYRSLSEPATLKGLIDFRRSYEDRFASSPNLHAEIRSRIVLSENVIDEEWVTGIAGSSGPVHVVAIYGFRDNLICQVWFAK